ncbi:MAG: hypothetical protein EXR80_06460 [Methylococcales bacterium]|nr:hypothetical protein [Methylococcales bacterium]
MANLKEQENFMEFPTLSGMDILETKLDLAKAYLEMGDPVAAKSTLNNVLHDDNFDNFDFDFDFFDFCDIEDSEAVKLILKNKDYINFSTPKKIGELIAIIAAIYKPNSVIDICCGYGNILSYFKNFKNVKGIEINAKVIKSAKHINSNIDFIVADTL